MIKSKLRKFISISMLVVTISTSIFTIFPSNIYANTLNEATNDSSSKSIWPEAPEVNADNFILIDADTGAILYQKNAYEKCYPASTTKILTGLLTIENCNMNEIITFSEQAAHSVAWDEANLQTKPGEQYTVEQALYGLLLYSANEIAYGLAEYVAGSVPAFVDMMNERAKEAGAYNTHFNNSSGLFDSEHYTTPYDLARIARVCYNNATFISIDSTSSTYSIGPTNMTPTTRTFKHRHQMLKGRPYYYEYCKGGKTGFTDQSKYTLVTFAEKDDMRLIAVCMNGGENTRFIDTRALFEWGFKNFKKVITTSDTLTSMIGNTNYYHSDVFNKSKAYFNLDVSSLTIPNNANIGDISVMKDDKSKDSSNNGIFTTNLKFVHQDNTVGTAKLEISSDNNLHSINNLPFKEARKNTAPSAKKCLVINVWIMLAVIAIIVITATIRIRVKRSRKNSRFIRKRHYK